MAAPQDVHVRICNQEIVKFDLEVKALIQVLIPRTLPRGPLVGSAGSRPSLHLVGTPRPWVQSPTAGFLRSLLGVPGLAVVCDTPDLEPPARFPTHTPVASLPPST